MHIFKDRRVKREAPEVMKCGVYPNTHERTLPQHRCPKLLWRLPHQWFM